MCSWLAPACFCTLIHTVLLRACSCFETSDVGAFYTDGEIGDRNGRDGNGKGDNFWSMRGSRVINNTCVPCACISESVCRC